MFERPRRFAGFAVASLALAGGILASPPAPHEKGPPHWSYEGKEGPEHWGDLDPSFATCKLGRVQSPIDISAATITG